MHLFQWWIMGPSAQRIQRNCICKSQDTVVGMQIKQGILINTEFPPPTKWSVNYCTISETWHLNKYFIMLEQNTCMFDKKNPSQFFVNADGIYCAINMGAFCCVKCPQRDLMSVQGKFRMHSIRRVKECLKSKRWRFVLVVTILKYHELCYYIH